MGEASKSRNSKFLRQQPSFASAEAAAEASEAAAFEAADFLGGEAALAGRSPFEDVRGRLPFDGLTFGFAAACGSTQ